MAKENFKKDAKDGDNDGIVQDGTEFERPTKVKGEDKVVIVSSKSVYWEGVGRIVKGYNVVTPEGAEKWLTRNGIRVATPEEVAKEYGI